MREQAKARFESHLRGSAGHASIVRNAGVAVVRVQWRSPSQTALRAAATMQQANRGWAEKQAPAPLHEGPTIRFYFGDEVSLATLRSWIENHPVVHSVSALDSIAVQWELGDFQDTVPRIRLARALLAQERAVLRLPMESVFDPMGHSLLDSDFELEFGASDLPLSIDPVEPRLRRALVSLRFVLLEFSEGIPLTSLRSSCTIDGQATTWLVHEGSEGSLFRTRAPLSVGKHRLEISETLTDFRRRAFGRRLSFDFEVQAWQSKKICETPANVATRRLSPPAHSCHDA